MSNAAEVARQIPRCNAWCITGTPLRKDVNDLLGLLIFLQYYPFCGKDIWYRLLNIFPTVLTELFGRIAIRHTKSDISEEISLPPQTRVTITMPLTATEEQNYAHQFSRACNAIGVDTQGGPVLEDWDPEDPRVVDAMRSWLYRLRKTCLYASAGARYKGGVDSTKSGPLRTVEAVLAVMLQDSETAVRAQEREMLQYKIMQGHLQSFGRAPKLALQTYLKALDIATTAVNECREQLDLERKRVTEAKLVKARQRNGGVQSDNSNDNLVDDPSSASDEEDAASTEQPASKQNLRSTTFAGRLRAALEVQHTLYFYVATAHFQIKEAKVAAGMAADAEECQEQERLEIECYDRAKMIRKELLAPVARHTTKLMDEVARLAKKPNAWTAIEHDESLRGLESRRILDDLSSLADRMTEYASQLNEWRSKLITALLKPLLDSEDDMELQGDEYENSTKLQDEIYVLMEAMRAGLADFQCLLSGQPNRESSNA